MIKLLEASAAEVYVQYFKDKLTPREYQDILKIDPSAIADGDDLSNMAKGSYTDWLIKNYLRMQPDEKKRFLEEDAEQVKAGLAILAKLTKNKEGLAKLQTVLTGIKNYKDINSYKLTDIRTLASASDQLGPSVGLKAEKQIDIVYNGKHIFACIPKTHEASRKYGTGTNWCTATSNDSYYESYSERGPLIIIIDKQNQENKWQYHDASSSFMDRRDAPTSTTAFMDYFIKKGPEATDELESFAEILGERLDYKKWKGNKLLNEYKKDKAVLKLKLAKLPSSRWKYATDIYFEALSKGDTYVMGVLRDAGLTLSLDDETIAAITSYYRHDFESAFSVILETKSLITINKSPNLKKEIVENYTLSPFAATNINKVSDLQKKSYLAFLAQFYGETLQALSFEERAMMIIEKKVMPAKALSALAANGRYFDTNLFSLIYKNYLPELFKTPLKEGYIFNEPSKSSAYYAGDNYAKELLSTQTSDESLEDYVKKFIVKTLKPYAKVPGNGSSAEVIAELTGKSPEVIVNDDGFAARFFSGKLSKEDATSFSQSLTIGANESRAPQIWSDYTANLLKHKEIFKAAYSKNPQTYMKKVVVWARKSAPICTVHELLCLALSLKIQEKADPVTPSFLEAVINQYLDRIEVPFGGGQVQSIKLIVDAKTLFAFIEKELTDVIDASIPFWEKVMKEREQRYADVATVAQKAFSSFQTDLSKDSMADIVSSRLARSIGSGFGVLGKELFSPSVWEDLKAEISSFRVKYNDYHLNSIITVIFRVQASYSFRAVLDRGDTYFGATPYLHYIVVKNEDTDREISAVVTSNQKSKSLKTATNNLISKLKSSPEFAVYEKAYSKEVANSLCILCAGLLYSSVLYWFDI